MALSCFDVTRPDHRPDLLVVYQNDFLWHLDSRLVIPLLHVDGRNVHAIARLNPTFDITGQRYVLWTQSAFSARLSELGTFHASLAEERDKIRDAFDFLTTGF